MEHRVEIGRREFSIPQAERAKELILNLNNHGYAPSVEISAENITISWNLESQTIRMERAKKLLTLRKVLGIGGIFK